MNGNPMRERPTEVILKADGSQLSGKQINELITYLNRTPVTKLRKLFDRCAFYFLHRIKTRII